MFTWKRQGKREVLVLLINALELPGEVLSHEAVRLYVIAHIPKPPGHVYDVTLNVQSINNAACSTMAGHLTVVVKEMYATNETRND